MAEFTNDTVQTVEDNTAIRFNQTIFRSCGVSHRTDSGIFKLAGMLRQCGFTPYKVTFHANIAVAEGGTVGPISIAIAQDGEALAGTTAIVTPAAVGEFFNVSASTYVLSKCGCCPDVSVINTSGTPIDVSDPNLIIHMRGDDA